MGEISGLREQIKENLQVLFPKELNHPDYKLVVCKDDNESLIARVIDPYNQIILMESKAVKAVNSRDVAKATIEIMSDLLAQVAWKMETQTANDYQDLTASYRGGDSDGESTITSSTTLATEQS